MQFSRQTLASLLRTHGENELAERALSVTDAELERIGELADRYFLPAGVNGGSMGGARAVSWAAIDVLEGTPRDLRVPRTELERDVGAYDLSDAESAKYHALRLQCLKELQPPRSE